MPYIRKIRPIVKECDGGCTADAGSAPAGGMEWFQTGMGDAVIGGPDRWGVIGSMNTQARSAKTKRFRKHGRRK